MLRVLADGSYLDLGLIFDVYLTFVIRKLHEVCLWLNGGEIANFNARSYLHDNEIMAQVAHGFRRISNYLVKGCISAF